MTSAMEYRLLPRPAQVLLKKELHQILSSSSCLKQQNVIRFWFGADLVDGSRFSEFGPLIAFDN